MIVEKPIPEKNSCDEKHKRTPRGKPKLSTKQGYELAEVMLSEHTNTWKLAFEEYLYNKASTRNERSLHDFNVVTK